MASEKGDSWASKWLGAVADGKSTMSQRSLASVERHGGGLETVVTVANQRGVHLVVLTDDKGVQLVAASVHPFKVLA